MQAEAKGVRTWVALPFAGFKAATAGAALAARVGASRPQASRAGCPARTPRRASKSSPKSGTSRSGRRPSKQSQRSRCSPRRSLRAGRDTAEDAGGASNENRGESGNLRLRPLCQQASREAAGAYQGSYGPEILANTHLAMTPPPYASKRKCRCRTKGCGWRRSATTSWDGIPRRVSG
jgi:hypothetical protein